MKIFSILILLFSCSSAFSFGGNKSTKKFTPGAAASSDVKRSFGQKRSYQKLDQQLRSLQTAGSTRCDRSPTSAAQCLVCNCLNEIGPYSQDKQVNVARVVFSRVKSPKFPNSICATVWQPSQFSWTIGVLDPRRRSRYISVRKGSGQNFNKCIQSTRTAADIELNKFPKKSFSLHYFNPKIVRPSWARACKKVRYDGAHAFYDDCSGSGYRAPKQLTESAIASRG